MAVKDLDRKRTIRLFFQEAERVRDQLRAKNGPIEDWIEPKFLEGHMECMSEMEEKRK